MERLVLVAFSLFLPVIGASVNAQQIETNFWYFSKKNPNELFEISKNQTIVWNAFVCTQMYFYVHGWKTLDLRDAVAIKNAIFANKNDVDFVILVDWREASMNYNFPKVAFDTVPKVAMNLVNELKALSEVYGMRSANIHMVGYDLGAHIMGQAGKLWNKDGLKPRIKEMTGNKKLKLQ